MNLIGQASANPGFPTCLQVEIHDGKFTFPPFVHVSEQGRGDDVDAAEGIFLILGSVIFKTFGLGLSGIFIYPSSQICLFVEQQIAGCGTLACQQGGIIATVQVVLV